jgi:uncharacterized protein YjbJ (UPF0337 family)
MSAVDKAKAVAEEIGGVTREVMGKMTGDEMMMAEGEAEVTDAKAKLSGDHDDDDKPEE